MGKTGKETGKMKSGEAKENISNTAKGSYEVGLSDKK